MNKLRYLILLLIVSCFFHPPISYGADIKDAQEGSIVINDGIAWLGVVHVGHAGVFMKYNSATGKYEIAEARSSTTYNADYPTFLSGNTYMGHFRTSHSSYKKSGFRREITRYAKIAGNGLGYTFLNLYSYWEWDHDDNEPYLNVVPDDFRCDGLAEWSIEQARAIYYSRDPRDSDGFYNPNSVNLDHIPINIANDYGVIDTGPDLSVQSVDAPSGTYAPGDSFSVGNQVKNIGGNISGNYSVKFYASTDTIISSSDYEIGSYNRSALEADDSHNKNSTVQLPTNLPQNSYYIGMILTHSDDGNTSNNSDYDSTSVSVVKATGFAKVSQGPSISPSTVTQDQDFTVSFTLKETKGAIITFEKVAVAILRPNNSHLFDLKTYENVTISANSTWNQSPTGKIYSSESEGTYKAVIRGKVAGGDWFDFENTDSGANPKSFSVIKPTAGRPSSITVPSSDSNGGYTVSWGSSSTSSVTYVLEEATNSSFSSGLRQAYFGTSTSTTISGRSSGSTYYYRVKAIRSGYTDSDWRTGSNGCTVTITPTLSYITVSGPNEVNESSGAEYTCTATYSDDSSSTVTSSSSWSENSSYASISSSGYLTTSSVSSDQACTITATYGGKSDTHSVTIKNIPPSGYTISGVVKYSSNLLANVKVELRSGTDAEVIEQTVFTNIAGEYQFDNVADGNYQLRAYGPTSEYITWQGWSLSVSGADVVLDLALAKNIVLLTPENGSTVTTLRPTLTWTPNSQAAEYIVQVNVSSTWELVDHPQHVVGTSYTLSNDLVDGETYTWQVGACDVSGTYVGGTMMAFQFMVNTNGCYTDLPDPELILKGTEEYEANGQQWTRYLLSVTNRESYPNELFEPAPDLPPCGLNENASRTWVDIYTEDGTRLYGFCALSSSADLDNIWFAVASGTQPPGGVYITMTDRRCDITYTSNLVSFKSAKINGWRYTRADAVGSSYYPWGSTEVTENTLQEKFSVNNAYGSVLTGDVTGNGHLELIYVSGDQLKIYDGTGNLLHSVTLGSSSCSVSMLEDINGDGVLDIGIGTGGTSDLKTYFYDGEGNLLKTLSKSAGYDCSMRPAGLLGNGDFVVSLNAGYSHSDMYRAFAVYDKDTGSEKWCYKVGPAFGITSIADFDGDGMLDFANEAHTVHNGCNADGYNNNGTMTTDGDIWLIVVNEQGNEKFSKKYSAPSNGSSRHYFVDLNHDGVMEMVGFEGHDPTYYRGTSEIHLFDQNGEITHTFAGSEDAGWSFTITDINGDGKNEVIASNYPGGQSLYVLDHNLAMQNSAEIAGRVQLSCDLNGDGNIEVVLLDDDGNLKVVDKNLQVLNTINVGSHGTVIAGDLDQDGIVELLCMTIDHGIHVLNNTRQAGQIKGDINADGNIDLADAILALKVSVGISGGDVYPDRDVNGDGRIGIEEVLYILQKVSKVR